MKPVAIPSGPMPWTDCIWSPDSTWLLCAGGQSLVRGDPTTRLIVNLTTKQSTTMKTGGISLVWLES